MSSPIKLSEHEDEYKIPKLIPPVDLNESFDDFIEKNDNFFLKQGYDYPTEDDFTNANQHCYNLVKAVRVDENYIEEVQCYVNDFVKRLNIWNSARLLYFETRKRMLTASNNA